MLEREEESGDKAVSDDAYLFKDQVVEKESSGFHRRHA